MCIPQIWHEPAEINDDSSSVKFMATAFDRLLWAIKVNIQQTNGIYHKNTLDMG
jgi:hypothetical protein